MADGRFITELTTRIHAFSSPQKFSRNSSSPKFKILHYISLSIQSLPLRKEDLLKSSSFFSSLILSHYPFIHRSLGKNRGSLHPQNHDSGFFSHYFAVSSSGRQVLGRPLYLLPPLFQRENLRRDTETSKPRCYTLPAPLLIKRSSRKSGAHRKRKLRHPAFLRYRCSLSIIILLKIDLVATWPCFFFVSSSSVHFDGLTFPFFQF